jgi:hypothetical protein
MRSLCCFVETDELELRERVEQLLMDGYAVDAVAAAGRARVRLADGPDAVVLCGALRRSACCATRAGEVPRADSTLPVLVVGADDDSAGVALPPRRRGCRAAVGELATVGGGQTGGAGAPRWRAADAGRAGRQPDRRSGRPDSSGGRADGEAHTARVRSAGEALKRATPDVHPRGVDPPGVGLRAAGCGPVTHRP